MLAHHLPVVIDQAVEARGAVLPSMRSQVGNRRVAQRTRTVYRIVPATTASGEQGLVRVRNISDGGMSMATALPLSLGDRVTVALSGTCSLDGSVVWTRPDECGIKFDAPIDSIDVLRTTALEAREPNQRQPRLTSDRPAVAFAEGAMRAVKVRDISQRGMKIEHRGGFTPGMPVRVLLESGVQRRGVVRWSQDGFAGLMLTETFTPAELGRLEAL